MPKLTDPINPNGFLGSILKLIAAIVIIVVLIAIFSQRCAVVIIH